MRGPKFLQRPSPRSPTAAPSIRPAGQADDGRARLPRGERPRVFYYRPLRIRVLAAPLYGWSYYLGKHENLSCLAWRTLPASRKFDLVSRFYEVAPGGMDAAQRAEVLAQIDRIDAECSAASAVGPYASAYGYGAPVGYPYVVGNPYGAGAFAYGPATVGTVWPFRRAGFGLRGF